MDAGFLDCPLQRRMEQKSTMMNRNSMALSGRLGVGPGTTVAMVVGSDLTIEAGRFVLLDFESRYFCVFNPSL